MYYHIYIYIIGFNSTGLHRHDAGLEAELAAAAAPLREEEAELHGAALWLKERAISYHIAY